jgi:hypothetical protein
VVSKPTDVVVNDVDETSKEEANAGRDISVAVRNTILCKGEVNAALLHAFTATEFAIARVLAILDSGANIHVFNDLSRFTNFRKARQGDYLQAGTSRVPILGYGDVIIRITRPNGSQGAMRLRDVAFCTDFVCNLVSFKRLADRGIYWNTKGNYLFKNDDTGSNKICKVHQHET